MFRYSITLMVICIVSALVLTATYKITAPIIAQAQQQRQQGDALMLILPQATSFEGKTIDGMDYYQGNAKGRLVGYILRVKTQGYADTIDMMVGIDLEGDITGMSVLDQQETPGLGANITEIRRGEDKPWFLKQFEGKYAKRLSLDNIDAITGATITTKAVINGVKEAVEKFSEKTL